MEGIHILNQFEVAAETVFSWHNFWMGFIIGAVVALISTIIIALKEQDWVAFFISLPVFIIFFGGFLGFMSGAYLQDVITYETRYEVSIDDEVNMKDFMDKYEIIETRGSIYTVREKDYSQNDI